MRLNVYSQELDLTRVPEVVQKEGTNKAGQPETFYGIRFYLISPPEIHQTILDDDQSAITFWLPASKVNRTNLSEHFRYMSWLVEQVTIT